ncbi:MAG: TfoX/Sxy family protein [Thiobacillaceae bacterium]
MAYDEGVAERLREAFSIRKDVIEKKMFGGIAFMVSGHMCCGVVNDTLMARVGADHYEAALKKPHASKMDFTGRPMKGFVYVAPTGFESDDDLADWVKRCLDFVTTLPAAAGQHTRR